MRGERFKKEGMLEKIKKTLNDSIDVLSEKTDKVQKSINELVDKGKLSSIDGSKITERLKTEWGQATKDLKEGYDELMHRLDWVPKEEVEKRDKKIEALEKEVQELRNKKN